MISFLHAGVLTRSGFSCSARVAGHGRAYGTVIKMYESASGQGNKGKIKVMAGDWINYLRGYFCCADMLLMSVCRMAALNNHLECVVWVSLGCHGHDCSSKAFHWIRQKLSRHIVLQDQPWQQRDERLWTDSSIKTELKLFSAPVPLLPGHTDSACRQRIQYWMSSDQSWNLRCFMLRCTLLIWPLWKYVNNPPQAVQLWDWRALIGNMTEMSEYWVHF